jgi:RNA-directed DNA polymerase
MPKSFPNLPQRFSDAYQWLCKSREDHPPDSDIWNFKRTWRRHAEAIMESLRTGAYRFDVQSKLLLSCGETIALWSSRDALVLKVLTGIIQERLKPFLLKTCYHLKGHGGLKGAVRNVMRQLPKYRFFCKTDVHYYYDSIDHYTLLVKLHDTINDRIIIGYVWQILNRCVEWGGLYQDIKKGIPRGSSLSPLLGAFYLMELDRKMEKLDVKYFRYMDDILILAPTRWKLKKAIRVLNRTFNELKLEQHPDKTLIGRTDRGFDFLGYFLRPGLLGVARKTVENFTGRIHRLYEQGADDFSIGEYVKRWKRWLRSGLWEDGIQYCRKLEEKTAEQAEVWVSLPAPVKKKKFISAVSFSFGPVFQPMLRILY